MGRKISHRVKKSFSSYRKYLIVWNNENIFLHDKLFCKLHCRKFDQKDQNTFSTRCIFLRNEKFFHVIQIWCLHDQNIFSWWKIFLYTVKESLCKMKSFLNDEKTVSHDQIFSIRWKRFFTRWEIFSSQWIFFYTTKIISSTQWKIFLYTMEIIIFYTKKNNLSKQWKIFFEDDEYFSTRWKYFFMRSKKVFYTMKIIFSTQLKIHFIRLNIFFSTK